MINTYKLYLKIKELRDASKSPEITQDKSWELCQLANELEKKYNFLIQLREELKKNDKHKTK